MLGWEAKRRCRRVDLPVPEGPERTRSLGRGLLDAFEGGRFGVSEDG